MATPSAKSTLLMEAYAINYLAVAVAAIGSFAFGALWYSPLLFSKRWQNEAGLSDEDVRNSNMAKIFGTTLVLTILMVIGLALLMKSNTSTEWNAVTGLRLGLHAGLLFSTTSIGINYLYQRKSPVLWAIDAGYQVLFMAGSGALLGVWH